MPDQPTATAAVCRHCGDHTDPDDDPAPDLCAMCAKAGRTTTTAACEWCGRAVRQNGEGRWYAVKGEERGYDPLTCEASDDARHEPDQPATAVLRDWPCTNADHLGLCSDRHVHADHCPDCGGSGVLVVEFRHGLQEQDCDCST